MTVTFYAQPYAIDAEGFYFSDAETYKEMIGKVVNRYGDSVEEFELQFIDGTVLNSKLETRKNCLIFIVPRRSRHRASFIAAL